MDKPLVGIIIGSDKDLEIMGQAAQTLEQLNIDYEFQIVSAHRTPEWMAEYGQTAAARELEVIIAAAGKSAHLPGMMAAYTNLPVIAVPLKLPSHGDESLKSSIGMPTGIPLAVMPENGAINAALYAAAILSLKYPEIQKRYNSYRSQVHDKALESNTKFQSQGWKAYLKGMQTK